MEEEMTPPAPDLPPLPALAAAMQNGHPHPPHPPCGLRAAPRRLHGKNDRAAAGLGISAAMAARVVPAVGPGTESCWGVTSFRPSWSRLCHGPVRG
jgi:hypothetical protein